MFKVSHYKCVLFSDYVKHNLSACIYTGLGMLSPIFCLWDPFEIVDGPVKHR